MCNCIKKEKYIISEDLKNEALNYAELSKTYTSDAHDFHDGGFLNKKIKMYEGKLGEKIFKMFLDENNISFEEDNTSHTESDKYDFIFPDKKTVDVKTRTKGFHSRTLEMVKQFNRNPKDIYVSVRLYDDKISGHILGWVSKKDILRINRIENNGYLDNYVIYDNELRPIEDLWNFLIKDFVK